MTESYEHLVDTGILAAAADKHTAATARLRQAETDLANATASHVEAEAASTRAIESGGDALEAEHNLHAAAMKLSVATKVHAAAVAWHAKTTENVDVSEALAWCPVAIDAGRKRVAACEKFDRARAMLAESDADYVEACALGAVASGHGAWRGAEAGLGRARPLAAELAAWGGVAHVVDLDAGTHAWTPGGYIP